MARISTSALACLLALTVSTPHALAAPGSDVDACLQSHEKAYMARDDGDLLATRDALRSCSEEACPPLVRRDCMTWLAEVERSIPSVAVAVVIEGEESEPNHFWLDGTEREVPVEPIEINPGLHEFRASHVIDGKTITQEEEFVVQPGLRRQVVRLSLDLPKPTIALNAAGTSNEDRTRTDTGKTLRLAGYITLGLAVGTGVGTLALGLMGMQSREEAEQDCAPFCDDGTVNTVRAQLVTADALGATTAALAVSAVTLLAIGYKRKGTTKRRKSAPSNLSFHVMGEGVGVSGRW